MRVAQTFYFLFAFLTTIHALALPASFESISEASKELWKRKGGGEHTTIHHRASNSTY